MNPTPTGWMLNLNQSAYAGDPPFFTTKDGTEGIHVERRLARQNGGMGNHFGNTLLRRGNCESEPQSDPRGKL
jgi:hypothetical protein